MEHKITKIEVQKNNKDRFNLYINGNFFAGIDAATYVHFNLRKDLILSDEDLRNIGEYDGYRVAINNALNYLSYKKRTELEVREYLNKCEVRAEVVDSVIQYCKENKYIDHEDYAKSYMNTLINTTDKGPVIFAQTLKQLGVEQAIIDKYQHQFELLVTSERIDKISQKVMKKYEKKQSAKMIEQKVIQTLIQKGYNLDIANDAMKNVKLKTSDIALDKAFEKTVTRLARKHEGFILSQKVIQSLMQKGFQYDDIMTKIKDSGLSGREETD
ncbi:recombination regulator RecX [Macrococcus armenti]|uniref:recombination regulator RecX n=1 Tax=Macrococcus armenti TaxID=2875764 RepID=UPI001CCF8CFF|nr:recombination regulator RecX [Macrococcus armenti]UBH12717.1 recombination regulator RecX [Macrococcus armenti]UBH21959.1 recombination regulator RecX [Macrococcus armenti]